MIDLIKLISDNGISIVCVGFMIYFINTTLKDNNAILDKIEKTLVLMQSTITSFSERIAKIEETSKEYMRKEK